MDRRQFITSGTAALGAAALDVQGTPSSKALTPPATNHRARFPRLEHEVYLNAARGTPLGQFASEAIDDYTNLIRYGYGSGRGANFRHMMKRIRGRFGELIGAQESEIALVQCTKAGEQIVLDGLPKLRTGGNIVTNEFHFGGSLHNLIGLRRSGLDVRIVRGSDWTVSVEAMADQIDSSTALVAITLVSDINGRVEPIRELATLAHQHGALVYADIIQCAGVLPFDVGPLGIDFAACSGYKWLYGIHGAGFFYVREDHQGSLLEDRLFPGHASRNYPPWASEAADPPAELFGYHEPTDARRYQPGHLNYLGLCALFAGIEFIHRVGINQIKRHSIELTGRLLEQVDLDRYPCISPDHDSSPIVTFLCDDIDAVAQRLKAANISVTLQQNRIRVSPAIYNTEDDIDQLAEALATV